MNINFLAPSRSPLIFVLLMAILNGSLHGQGALRIMPLGNSITVGETGEPNPDLQPPPEQLIGYRYGLKYLLQQAGYNVDFVGSQSNGSAFFSDCQHAGIGGSRDQYVERLIIDGYDERNDEQILNPPRNYLDAFDPDIILLHIGTNDITHEPDPIASQRVTAILDLIDQYEQREGKVVTVFLAQIINRREPCVAGSGCPTTRLWNEWLGTMAEARIASGDHIVLVDMEHDAGIVYTNEDFTASDPQGLHLNPNGYGKMAALWYTTLINNFNTVPSISPIPDQSITEHQAFDQIVLDNYVYDVEDADSDLNWSTYSLTTSNLIVTIDQNRVATISRINPSWSGTESIVFQVTDNGVNGSFQKTARDTVSFTIIAQEDPPEITGQNELSVEEDGYIQLSLEDFTIYDPDQGQSTEEYVLHVQSGNHYSVTGTTVYPEPDYDSDLLVNVSVSDNAGSGPVYQADIGLIAVNDPPEINEYYTINIEEDESYTVTFNDIDVGDVDNILTELQIVMSPGNDYSIEGQTIHPDPDYSGIFYIESHVEDPEGAKSATINLQVEVASVNDPPRFTTEPEDTAIVDKSYVYAFDVEDPDDGQIQITIAEKPNWMIYYPNSNLLAGIPSASNEGYTRVKIHAYDGEVLVEQKYYLHVLLGTSGNRMNFSGPEPKLFPNPSKSQFFLDYRDYSSEGTFTLYSLLGSVISEEILYPGQQIVFSVTELNLQPGIYLYTIQAGANNFNGKLIVEFR